MAYSKHVLVNIPTKDLEASSRFAVALGLVKNNECCGMEGSVFFTHGENTHIAFHDHKTFSPWLAPGRSIANAASTTQMFVSISAESKEAVDKLVAAAIEAGGKRGPDMAPEMENHGVYSRSVEDTEGNVYEIVFIDKTAGKCGEKAA